MSIQILRETLLILFLFSFIGWHNDYFFNDIPIYHFSNQVFIGFCQFDCAKEVHNYMIFSLFNNYFDSPILNYNNIHSRTIYPNALIKTLINYLT